MQDSQLKCFLTRKINNFHKLAKKKKKKKLHHEKNAIVFCLCDRVLQICWVFHLLICQTATRRDTLSPGWPHEV